MTRGKKTLRRLLLLTGAAGALIGGVASAELPECFVLYACGTANEGGYLYCMREC
jgi:hypothetical protein